MDAAGNTDDAGYGCRKWMPEIWMMPDMDARNLDVGNMDDVEYGCQK